MHNNYKYLISILLFPFFVFYSPIRFVRKREISNIHFNNILVVAFHSGIGDFIFLSPLFKNLRQKYKDAKITVLMRGGMNDEFLVNNPNVNNILKIRVNEVGRFELLKYAWNELRRSKYDLLIERNGVSGIIISLFCFLTGAKYRIGINDPMSGFLNTVNLKKIIQPKWDGKTTFIENHLKVMNVLGQSYYDSKPDIFLPQSTGPFINDYFKKNMISESNFLIGIHVGSDGPGKGRRWATENFIGLINRLSDMNSKIVFFLLCGPAEEEEVGMVYNNCNNQKVFIFKENMVKTAALIKRCAIFISNDSMPLHLAITLDVPTIGIFGPTNPFISYGNNKLFFPLYRHLDCQPCWTSHIVSCKHNDFRCLNWISVNNVVDLFIVIMEKRLGIPNIYKN